MSQLPVWLMTACLTSASLFITFFLLKRFGHTFLIFWKYGWGCASGKGHKWEKMRRFDTNYNLYEINVCSKCGLAVDGQKVSDEPKPTEGT